MKIKGIIFEDTINYKKISLTIMMPYCSFKCDKEYGSNICQNGALANSPNIEIDPEQIPGESAADKLMNKDKFFFGDANIYDLPLYGNQFIPLGIQTTGNERIKVQAAFDSYCNGGSILHYNIDAPFDSFEKAMKMTKYIARQGVTYFAFNTKIQVCKNNHAFYGKTCPVCGNPVDAEFTRIVG
jgi:ribonucleoside-triphosphate reductase